MMKKTLYTLLVLLIALSAFSQTNTFPTTGNVGIGTTSPNAKLEVKGDFLRLQETNQGRTLDIYPSSTGAFHRFTSGTTAAGFSFENNSGALLNITSQGNVGIGTTSPASSLHVSSAISNAAKIRLGRQNSLPDDYFEISTVGGGGRFTQTGGSIDFYTSTSVAAANNFAMRIAGNGNVGIGTTSPSVKLEIKDNQDSNFNSGFGLVRSSTSQTGYLNMVGGAFNMNAPSGLPIKFRDGGTTNLTILGNGNVGIGTASPNAKLHVAQGQMQVGDNSSSSFGLRLTRTNASVASDVHLYNASANTPVPMWIEGGYFTGERVGVVTAANAGFPYYEEYVPDGAYSYKSLGFINQSSGSFSGSDIERIITLRKSGNVGIGTTSPTERLSVDGNILAKRVRVSVDAADWPDYVCANGYKPMAISKLEQYIKQHQHLPEVPSAEEVEEKGLDLGSMDATLLKKVEELTLYLVEQNKRLMDQNKQLMDQNKRLKELEKQNKALEKEIKTLKK